MRIRIAVAAILLALTWGNTAHADETENLIVKYYSDILDRSPDAAGLAYWKAEIERVAVLRVDRKEGFIALAKLFFNSDEYIAQGKSNVQYAADLYRTFSNRAPEQAGLDYWAALLDQGVGRNVILNYFVYGEEFSLYMRNLFGADSSLPECNLVNDLYRGL
ncbi:MAG: DUF4214 domain-containing protein [Desulfobacterales bacterium]|nr:MAG: DUF4214 domain-containing protein [Desulfobacterales bacterium]